LTSNLTDRQKVTAEYWADGPRSEFPPGHWALITQILSRRRGDSLDTDANQTSTPVSVQTWWVADASVYGIAASHDLGPTPDETTGSFSLPFGFYATVTVYATATWPDGKVTTNASWAVPVADCNATTSPPTTVVEPPTSIPPTTIDDSGNGNGNGNGNGHGNGNGRGNTTTTIELG
jgi:hypothetical protein